MTVEGVGVPRPVFSFEEANFPRTIIDLLHANFQKPTVIQSISWPIALSGRDMVSIAKTGSGKTLAVRHFCNTVGVGNLRYHQIYCFSCICMLHSYGFLS